MTNFFELLQKYNPMSKPASMTDIAFDTGVIAESERIIKWIEENRSAIEIEPGEYLYRDHFNSQSLIAFIKGENK
jgi:hypothetical protein